MSKSPAIAFAEDELQRAEARNAELERALAAVQAQNHELERTLRLRDEAYSRLEAELEDAQLLHGISAMLVDENNVGELYQKLVDAATLLMRSDYGSMQRYDPERGELQLVAHRDLNAEAIDFWQWVHPGQATTCGRALQTGACVIVPDFETCDFIAGSPDLVAFRAAGVRSAQSTPLLTREGRLVGMITTHWTRVQVPRERDLRLLDVVARQAADLIERITSAEALRRQAARLLDADRYKDEFLATLAHELRNPLAPIRTGLTLLKSGTPAQAARVLPIMERQLGHMVRLVDDLLDVSRISRGQVTLRRGRVDLRTVIDSAVEASGPLIEAAQHRFSVSVPADPVWLDADTTRVVQIVSNLLNNAAKYTPRGGTIELVARAEGGGVAIRVADTGIGIPAPMLPKIFELFTQVDHAAERSQGGLGVGLALSRQLAQMHGGRIEAASAGEGAGAVFTLWLPALEAAAPAPAAVRAAAPAARHGLRVLVVDDNADAAHTFALLLEALGHAAQVVLDPTGAVAAARAFGPDIVFLDIGMPHLDGYALAQLLRAEPALRHVRLAALSGWGGEEDRARSRRAGIDHHLTKPVAIDEVTGLLAALPGGMHADVVPAQAGIQA